MRKFLFVLAVLMCVILVFGTAAFAINDRLARRISEKVDLISDDIINCIMAGLRIYSESYPEYPEELKGMTSADFPSDGLVNMLEFAVNISSADKNSNLWRFRVLHDATPAADVKKGSVYDQNWRNLADSIDHKPRVGWIEYGQEDLPDMVMSLGHLDTVGMGELSGWNARMNGNPFQGIIEGDRIYGRGTTDDKGPTIASAYALGAMYDLGISVNRRIRVVFGTDEERPYWYGINYYKNRGGELPLYGFSPDSGSPTLHEKGIINAWPTVSFDEPGPIYVISADSMGVAYNAITDNVTALIGVEAPYNISVVLAALHASIDMYPMLKGDANYFVSADIVSCDGGNCIKIYSKAMPGHGMAPTGRNAYVRLLKAFSLFESGANFEAVARNTMKALSSDINMSLQPGDADHEQNGRTFKIYYEVPIFGTTDNVTVNVGLVDWKREKAGSHTRASFTFNIRFPYDPISLDVGAGQWMEENLPKALNGDAIVGYETIPVLEGPAKGFIPNVILAYPPMKLDPDGWRIESARRVMRMERGTELSVGRSSGGGTYAKAFINRLFNFGTFSGAGGHGYDEYLTISSIWPAVRLMMHGFVEMAATDNVTWDVIGSAFDEHTKRYTNISEDVMVSLADFNAAVSEIPAAYSTIKSVDVVSVRRLGITQFATGVDTVSFRVDTSDNPLNYALIAKNTSGNWKIFPFKTSIREVGDIDASGNANKVNKNCIIAVVNSNGETNMTAIAGRYVTQYAIAKSTSQLYIPVTDVTVTPDETIAVSTTYAMTVAFAPANASDKDLTWSSSNTAVAAVDESGVVTGVSEGSATITATSVSNPAASGSANITVVVPVSGVSVLPTTLNLKMGETGTLTESVMPTNATDPSVTWTSDNVAVATVSDGTVTAVGIGKANITVITADGEFEATCAVSVVPIPVTPTYPSDKGDVATDTSIAANDLQEKDGMVFIRGRVAEAIAKGLLGLNNVEVSTNPILKATVSPNGGVAQIAINVTGKQLFALNPQDVTLIGMTSGNAGDFFEYVNDEADFDANKFTILFGGAIYTGEIDPEENYEVVFFIEDGGLFDLDGIVNGNIVSSVFFAAEKAKSGSSGCSTYGYFALALLGIAPFVLRRK